MAAITRIGVTPQSVEHGLNGPSTKALPAGVAARDLLVLLLDAEMNSTGPNDATVAGYTRLSAVARQTVTAGRDHSLEVFYKIAGPGEPAAVVTPGAGGGYDSYYTTQIAAFRGVHLVLPLDAAGPIAETTGGPSTYWFPSGLTTGTDSAMVLSAVARSDDNALYLNTSNGFTTFMGAPAGYTSTAGFGHAVGLAGKVLESAGDSGAPVWYAQADGGVVDGPGSWLSVTFAVRAGAFGTVPSTSTVGAPTPFASFALSWAWHDTAATEMIGEGVQEASALITAQGASAVMIGTGMQSAVSPAKGHRPRAIVVDQHGTTLCELPDARIGSISYGLNEAESWSITLLQNDPAIAFASVPFQEVQIWRGDQLLAWGPCTRWGYDEGYWTGQYKGALWYLSRRYIGKANRHNWVHNGSFEEGLNSWSGITNQVWNYWGNPGAQPGPPEAESVTNPLAEGHRAMRERNFVAGADAWISQDFYFTVDGAYSPEGDTFTLKGYLYLTAPIPEGQGPNEGRGLYLERFSSTQLDPSPWVQEAAPGAPLSLETSFVKLDESTPVGVWTRFETEFVTPPKGGEPEIINVRLYAPANIDVYWDAISLTLIEKLAFYNVDQSQIVAGLVAHLQDGYYEKSNLNISTDTPPTGVVRTRVYIHSEHPPGWRAISEFTELDNGLDFRMIYTPTQRIFTTAYPRGGAYKPAYPLRLETDSQAGNIAHWSLAYDGEGGSSSVIVLGTGSGSDREEGGATDASGWANGVTLEEVFTAPDETALDALGSMANERLRAARSPYTLDVTLYPPQDGGLPDLIGNIWPGDDLDVAILRHVLDVEGQWRVVKVTLDLEAQTMSLTLNPPFVTTAVG